MALLSGRLETLFSLVPLPRISRWQVRVPRLSEQRRPPELLLRPQAPANGATPKLRAAPERAPSFGAGLDKEAVDSGFSPEDLAALAQIPQGEKMKNGSEKTRYVPETALVEVAEEEEETLKESQSPSVAGALMKLSEVLAAMQTRSSKNTSLEDAVDASLCQVSGTLEVVVVAVRLGGRISGLCYTKLFETNPSSSRTSARGLDEMQ
ncbi:unnamed protein product [Polarella glacialis]|uniref:Uncharacterized protein n=1 Tax=Polarella glacialis TaxID=89957 RepID=A0A813E9E6_POLGL|nr:unnamed protein product [Polarella glacialis]